MSKKPEGAVPGSFPPKAFENLHSLLKFVGPTIPHLVVSTCVGAGLARLLAELPPSPTSPKQADIIQQPFTYLSLLNQHPETITAADNLINDQVENASLLTPELRASLTPHAQRAVISGWLQNLIHDTITANLQLYLEKKEPQAKLPLETGVLIEMTQEIMSPSITPTESAPPLNRESLPPMFWQTLSLPVFKSLDISMRHFSQVLERVCELDRHQSLRALHYAYHGQKVSKTEAHMTAEERLLKAFKRYLYHLRSSGPSTLTEIYRSLISIGGLKSIVTSETQNYFQGAWSEVTGTELFTDHLSNLLTEMKVYWLFPPEELDMQGVDSLIVISDDKRPIACLVLQIKSLKGLEPNSHKIVYAYADPSDSSFSPLIDGDFSSASKMGGRRISSVLDRVKADLTNATRSGTKENRDLQQIVQNKYDFVNGSKIPYVPILLLVPGDPKYYLSIPPNTSPQPEVQLIHSKK